MSNYRVGETADLFDPTTGAWVGVLDRNGKEQEVATPAAVAAALYYMGRRFRYLNVATKCRGPNNLNNTYTQGRSRIGLTITRPQKAGQWVMEFPNFYSGALTGEAGPGAAATINAAFEYPRGTLNQLTFGGSVTGTIPNNGRLQCDPINVDIPVGGVRVRVETFIQCSGGIVSAYGAQGQLDTTTTGDNMQLATSGLTNTTMTLNQAITNTVGAQGYGPCAVLGWTDTVSVFANGDSLTRGTGDSGYAQASYLGEEDPDGQVGLVERSLGRQCAYIQCGTGGETAQAFAAGAASYSANRVALARYCSHHLIGYSHNDLNAGRTSAQLIADIGTIVDLIGLPAFAWTAVPVYPTSTDGFTTYSGQTAAANNVQRVAYNSALRYGQVGKLAGAFDVARFVEAGKDSGIWKTAPNARIVTDGTATSGSKTIGSASAAFTPDDLGKLLYVGGAGAAGGNLTQYITKINSATSVDVNNNAGTTVASGATIRIGYNQYTMDGVHPYTTGVQAVVDSRVIDVRRMQAA